MLQIRALEAAGQVNNQWAYLTAFAVLATFLAWKVHRTKPGLTWFLVVVATLLGLAAILAQLFPQIRGIYRVQITVVSPGGQQVNDAKVTSTIDGTKKKAEDTWQLDIAPQVRPADRKVTVYAQRPDAYQAGNTTFEFGNDYTPSVTIHLAALAPVTMRGTVRDDHGKSVSQARVSVSGYHNVAVTDDMGNFELPAHAAEGQLVALHAEKEELVADVTVPAGTNVTLIVRNHR